MRQSNPQTAGAQHEPWHNIIWSRWFANDSVDPLLFQSEEATRAMRVKVRTFKVEDAGTLAVIFHASIHAIGKNFYTPQQLDAWSPAPLSAEGFMARMGDGRAVFVAVDQKDTPHAFIELIPDGQIDRFYCHPNTAGQGIGKQLYDRLEAEARALALMRLRVEASEAAKGFFHRQNFTLITRREFQRHDVWIHNYAMEKVLG